MPSPSPPSNSRARLRKSTLYCPECSHASLAARGDWVVRAVTEPDGRAVVYRCPECGADVVVQPVLGEDGPGDRQIVDA